MFDSCPLLTRESFLAKADKATWPDLPMDLRGIAMRSVIPHGSQLSVLIKQQVLWVPSLHTSQFFPCKSWGSNLELLREVVLTAPDIHPPSICNKLWQLHFPHTAAPPGLHPAGGRAECLAKGEPSCLIYHELSVPLVPRSTKVPLGISVFSRLWRPTLTTTKFKREIHKIKTKLWAAGAFFFFFF